MIHFEKLWFFLLCFVFEYTSFGSDRSIYHTNYVGLGVSNNYPTMNSNESISHAHPGINVKYEYFLSDSYFVELGFSNRIFRYKASNSIVSFFTLSDGMHRLFLLYHPLYLSVGGKFHYAYPMNSVSVSGEKSDIFGNEVMGSLSIGTHCYLSKEWLVAVNFDRWRGVNSSKIHAFEIGLILSRSL